MKYKNGKKDKLSSTPTEFGPKAIRFTLSVNPELVEWLLDNMVNKR